MGSTYGRVGVLDTGVDQRDLSALSVDSRRMEFVNAGLSMNRVV